MSDGEPVEVLFRVGRRDTDDVFALFPTLPGAPPDFCTCYQHIRQHSSANYTLCIGFSRPATPGEYADLKAELEGRGYTLIVIQRASYRHHQQRREAFREYYSRK